MGRILSGGPGIGAGIKTTGDLFATFGELGDAGKGSVNVSAPALRTLPRESSDLVKTLWRVEDRRFLTGIAVVALWASQAST